LRIALFYIIFFMTGHLVMGQEVPDKGMPYLNVYMPEQYENSGKVWDIESNDQNILFLAADKGLLEFDGTTWQLYKGSKGFTRSLHIISDTVLYTGSDQDFGKWVRNDRMDYEYTSLYPFKENVSQITEEFWGVHQIKDFIIFVSFNNIYVYKNDQLTKISAPSRFSGSHMVGDDLYLVDDKYGVYLFDGVSLNLKFSYPEGNPLQIVGLSLCQDDLLIVTQNQGVLKYTDQKLIDWSGQLSRLLRQDQAFSFTTINDSFYVFGTILNGIYITNADGRIIQHINKKRGLPNNTLLDVYYSPNGILWLSMDLGITGIQLSQNLAYVFDYSGNFGTGQTAILHNDIFYLGTNQGLYTRAWSKITNSVEGISFDLLPGSAGQVWDLELIDEDVLCGHDKGLFVLDEGRFKSISDRTGILDIIPLGRDRLLAGTYNGIYLFENIQGSWTFIHELEYIKGACSQVLLEDEKTIWVMIPNYGVIKAQLNSSYNVEERTIFPLEQFNGELMYLEKSNHAVYIVTDQWRYTLDPVANTMQKSESIRRTDMVKHRLPDNYPPRVLNDSYLFYTVYNGFALKNEKEINRKQTNDTLLLRGLEAFNADSSFVLSIMDEVPYRYNNLRVNCIIPHQEHVTYRYFIEGYMEKWSDWSEQAEFEILNLSGGEHLLQVEGRIDSDAASSLQIPIRVQTPWYQSTYAYLGYLLILVFVIYGLYRLQKYKLSKQREQLLYQEQVSLRLQAEEFRKESVIKKHEEVEKEKNELEKELRSAKIQLVIKAKEGEDKTRVIQQIKEQLQKLKGSAKANDLDFKALFRVIESHQEKEDDTFKIQMDELNQEFIQKLKSDYPSLTMYDLRLCTYIKTGLSTREIAELMQVLPSSINVSRSRLRKKLKLQAKDDLFTFLEGV